MREKTPLDRLANKLTNSLPYYDGWEVRQSFAENLSVLAIAGLLRCGLLSIDEVSPWLHQPTVRPEDIDLCTPIWPEEVLLEEPGPVSGEAIDEVAKAFKRKEGE